LEEVLSFLSAGAPGGISHEGYISIMVTILGIVIAVLAVILTIGAIVISVMAYFGYQEMLDRVMEKAEAAAKNVSMVELTNRAEAIAKQTATRTARSVATKTAQDIIEKNKDGWMKDLKLSMELSAAQAEPETAAEASISVEVEGEEIGKPYPTEENTNARRAKKRRNAGPSDPAPSS
jgi:acyl-coenzyme A synthetase/AMP-(fatty) acid ligase